MTVVKRWILNTYFLFTTNIKMSAWARRIAACASHVRRYHDDNSETATKLQKVMFPSVYAIPIRAETYVQTRTSLNNQQKSQININFTYQITKSTLQFFSNFRFTSTSKVCHQSVRSSIIFDISKSLQGTYYIIPDYYVISARQAMWNLHEISNKFGFARNGIRHDHTQCKRVFFCLF